MYKPSTVPDTLYPLSEAATGPAATRNASGRRSGKRFPEPVVLVLEGGGVLGAFQCGAYAALVPYLQARGHRIAALAGSSIGAINAAKLTLHQDQPDWGAQALTDFWQNSLASPSMHWMPGLTNYGRRWNGLLTSVLLGHPRMFRPNPLGWLPGAAAARLLFPLYNTAPMQRLLEEQIGTIERASHPSPLLMVRAVDIEGQKPRNFSSWHEPISPSHLRASASMPLVFPPVQVDGCHFWDGSFWPQTMVADVLALLESTLPPQLAPRPYWVISIDTTETAAKHLPVSELDITYRAMCLMFGHRADQDQAEMALSDRHAALVAELTAAAIAQPGQPWEKRVFAEAERLKIGQAVPNRFARIRRHALQNEHISRDLDYTPENVGRLMAQGYQVARDALDAWQEG